MEIDNNHAQCLYYHAVVTIGHAQIHMYTHLELCYVHFGLVCSYTYS